MQALVSERFQKRELLGGTPVSSTSRATDTTTGRLVVLKSVRSRGAEGKALELVEREARVLSNLDHPRIPGCLGLLRERDAEGETISVVTAWVPGQNLAQLMASGKRFTEAEALRMTLELVEILEYLHGFSPPIIHRDIKPSNVIRTPEGALHLVDFGGVRDRMMQDASPHGGGMTIVGTFGYMPYEQFEGRAVPASDIYALGVTLVSVLSHKEPSDLDRDGMRLRIRGEVNVSEPFLDLLERMLAPEWQERPQSAAELKTELHRLLDPAGRPALAAAGRRAAAMGMLLAAGLLLLLALVLVRSRQPGREPAPIAKQPPRLDRPSDSIVGLPVVRGRLLWDGTPVVEVTRTQPTFWFRDEDKGREVSAAARYYPDGRFEVYTLRPGRYGMNIRIDANASNAYVLPGDLESFTIVTLAEGRVEEVDVHMLRILHLLSPQDNGSAMPGWNAACEEKPAFPGPVRFAWEPLAEGAWYDYQVDRVICPYRHDTVVASGSTAESQIVLPLPPTPPGMFYKLDLSVRKSGRRVGTLMTTGAGGLGWDYRFRVSASE